MPESTADKLHHMAAELTLRCVLAGILAVVLLHFGPDSRASAAAASVLDPDAAPAAFYAANLLLFAASLFVGYPVLRGRSDRFARPSQCRDDARTGRCGGPAAGRYGPAECQRLPHHRGACP